MLNDLTPDCIFPGSNCIVPAEGEDQHEKEPRSMTKRPVNVLNGSNCITMALRFF